MKDRKLKEWTDREDALRVYLLGPGEVLVETVVGDRREELILPVELAEKAFDLEADPDVDDDREPDENSSLFDEIADSKVAGGAWMSSWDFGALEESILKCRDFSDVLDRCESEDTTGLYGDLVEVLNSEAEGKHPKDKSAALALAALKLSDSPRFEWAAMLASSKPTKRFPWTHAAVRHYSGGNDGDS